ncbi:MAG: hypothetical protein J0H23_05860 [Micrococcales bacterium]|nr:hypothetical protein [Micrococcales bacterium]OJX67774.1 MAG: hypothetical protein BGO94_02875 [Micrococcales bacterium 72-143]
MPSDPIEIERARDRLQQLVVLHRTAAARAARPPLVEETAWRGPAYFAYRMRAEGVAAALSRVVGELDDAVVLAREELARALR